MSIAAYSLSQVPVAQATLSKASIKTPAERTLVPLGDPIVIPEAR